MDPFRRGADYSCMVCRTPGWLAALLVAVVATAPLGRTAHAQPAQAWPDDPIPPAPARPAAEPPPPRTTRDVLREDPELGPRYRAARAMAIGGGVTMGVGLVLPVLAGGIALADAPFQRTDWEGEPVDYAAARGSRVAVIGLLVAGTLAVVGGATLLGIGVSRRSLVVEEARRVTLGFGRGGLSLRF